MVETRIKGLELELQQCLSHYFQVTESTTFLGLTGIATTGFVIYSSFVIVN